MIRRGHLPTGLPSVSWLAFGAACLIFIALTLRLALTLGSVDYDEAIFMDVARSIRSTGLPIRSIAPDGWMFVDHTPLYSYTLALVSWAGELPARLLSLAFGLAMVLMVARLGGPLGGILVALNPLVIELSASIWIEAMLGMLVVAASLLLLRGHVRAAAIVAALAVLTKELALAFVAAGAIYLLVRQRPHDAARFSAPALVVLAAWVISAMLLAPTEMALIIQRWVGAFIPGTIQAPMGLDRDAWLSMLGPVVLGPPLLLSLLVGLLAGRNRLRVDAILLLGTYGTLALAASIVMRIREPRHLVAVVAALAVVGALSLPGRLRPLAMATAFAFGVGLLDSPLVAGRIAMEADLMQVRDAALEEGPGPVIVGGTYVTVEAWYSGRSYVVTP